ncbi:MAG: hypothetical protein ACRER5_22695 [Pseudomonas sp.]
MLRLYENAMSDAGVSGFFTENPNGAFTIHRDGGWVVNDLHDVDNTLRTYPVPSQGWEADIAPSALVQGF